MYDKFYQDGVYIQCSMDTLLKDNFNYIFTLPYVTLPYLLPGTCIFKIYFLVLQNNQNHFLEKFIHSKKYLSIQIL
jgi:hypothetical protein